MDWASRRATSVLESALQEDRATHDATSHACIDAGQLAVATILAKQDCVLAGIGAVARIFEVFAQLEGSVHVHAEVTTHPEIFDGVRLHKGQPVAVIRHNARAILSCERVILNLLQRMSGIATATRRYVDAIAGTKCRILDTRKTAPGLRLIDKYAVRCGGGQNHRLDLSDGILVKNNHVDLAGGIREVLGKGAPQPPGRAADPGGSALHGRVGRRAPVWRRGHPAGQHDSRAGVSGGASAWRATRAAYRWRPRAASPWRTCAPTPRRAWTTSPWGR